MDLRNVMIRSDRFLLVPICSKYRQDIFLSFTDQVARYTFPQPTGNMADTDAFISGSSESMGRGEELQFVVVIEASGEFIGCAGLHHVKTRPEPGLWLKESAWNNGFGFEIVAALKQWADENIRCEYLYYPVKKENYPSRRIAEKLGGVLEEGEFISKNSLGEDHVMVAYRIYRT